MKRTRVVVFLIHFCIIGVLCSLVLPAKCQGTFTKKGANSLPKTKNDSIKGEVETPSELGDSLSVESDSTVGDSLLIASKNEDSLKQVRLDSLKASSDLKEEVKYQAEDSLVLILDNQKLFLYSSGVLSYEKITLNSDSIAVDFDKNILYAAGKKDSTGELSGFPVFTDEKQPYSAKKMSYNFKTKKGKVVHARTKQDDQYLIGDSLMLAGQTENGKDIIYIKNGKFTSCDAEDPHFYIKSHKLKIISGEQIISGPLQLVVEDFPIPVVIPFGFFPNRQGKKSGIILPQYGESAQMGFFLKKLGYYWAVNDYLGLKFTGDIYTKGSWGAGIDANYKKRYKFDGSLRTTFNVRKNGERTDPDFLSDTTFSVNWVHRQEFNPTTRLTGNVNIESAKYRQINALDDQFFQTNLSSNITFTKSFPTAPYNLSVNLLQNQNNSNRKMDLTLPEIMFSRTSRIYPFRKKTGKMKKAWSFLENTGLNYSMNMKNKVSAPDSIISRVLFFPSKPIFYDESLLDSTSSEGVDSIAAESGLRGFQYYRAGIKHSIPVSTNFTLFKYFNLQPSFNYNEYWMFNSLEKTFIPAVDSTSGFIETDTTYGFFTARDFSFRLNTVPNFYGFYSFLGKNEVTIRQTLSPEIGFSWKPDFSDSKWGYYKEVQKNDEGETQTYNRFSQSVQGSPSSGENRNINYGFSTRLELKIRDRKAESDSLSEGKKYKKINLLDNFGFRGSYNFAADSLNLSNVRFNARTSLYKNKITFAYSSNLTPYILDSIGKKYNTYELNSSGKLGTFLNHNFTVTTSLKPKKKSGQEEDRLNESSLEWTDIEYLRSTYVDYSIPWSATFTYNLNLSGVGESQRRTHTVSVRGDVKITPKWKVGYQTGVDIENKKINYTRFTIHRDLHCWELNFGFVPFGERKNFTFTLNVKSPSLKDLKISKGDRLGDKFF